MNPSEYVIGGTSIDGIKGYWIGSKYVDENGPFEDEYGYPYYASLVHLNGAVPIFGHTGTSGSIGIRPIITLSTSELK